MRRRRDGARKTKTPHGIVGKKQLEKVNVYSALDSHAGSVPTQIQ